MKIIFKKIPVIIIVISMLPLFFAGSCKGPNDGPTVILSYTHPRGNPLAYQYTVEWSNINNGDAVYIYITPGPNSSASNYYRMYDLNGSSSGSTTFTYNFFDNNPSPTIYIVSAEIRKSDGTTVVAHSLGTSITVSYQVYNIIQLQMTNDNLFPNYTDNSQGINYNGYQQLNSAFGDANTEINIKNNIQNFSTQVDFSSSIKLQIWTITNAGGDPNNYNSYGLGNNLAIICGVENIPNSIDAVTPSLTDLTDGFTWMRSENSPPFAYVRYDRIRANFSDTYSQIREMTGVAIHELGHARGINHDDPIIDPPHSVTIHLPM